MRVVLVGFRGVGKTAVAGALASKLGLEVVSTDREIENRSGSAIPVLVERYGWGPFREMEASILGEAVLRENIVLDTGGGIVLREDNCDLLKRCGFVVWLTAPPNVIRERIGGSTHRPSLTGESSTLDEVEEVLGERNPLYREVSDFTIDTSGMEISRVVEEIAGILTRDQPLGSSAPSR